MITAESILARHPDVASAAMGDEAVVVPPAGPIHVLEPIAALLWQCLDGESALAEIATDFAAQFRVATDEVLDQFVGLATRWHAAGIAADDLAVVPTTTPANGWCRLPPAPDP